MQCLGGAFLLELAGWHFPIHTRNDSSAIKLSATYELSWSRKRGGTSIRPLPNLASPIELFLMQDRVGRKIAPSKKFDWAIQEPLNQFRGTWAIRLLSPASKYRTDSFSEFGLVAPGNGTMFLIGMRERKGFVRLEVFLVRSSWVACCPDAGLLGKSFIAL
jgi:hypothetical protein